MCCNEDDWRAAELVLGAQSSPCEPSGPGTTGTKRNLIISWAQKGPHGTHTDPESIEYVRGPFSSMLTLKWQKKQPLLLLSEQMFSVRRLPTVN